MKNRRAFLFLALSWSIVSFAALSSSDRSSVWVADLGNGKYQNPILNADYSDPDVCRVGDDYYMTSSSFNCVPGLQILHSKDLVNWTIVGAALARLEPEDHFSVPQHGCGVWAPSIRHHNGEFFIFWGDPDFGIYRVKTTDPRGQWDKPVLVKSGKGLIDPCPLWDQDEKAYLVHAYAGSRAGFKSLLAVAPMNAAATSVLGESRIVYDGHLADTTIEGPKFYRRGDYYYLFAPAGGVPTGWQLVLRSRSPWGPYERKVVLAQGKSAINGPHQGAWVDTPAGENWFFHFQDKYVYGRVVHLQPMQWENDWPVIGVHPNKEGCGEPTVQYAKPKTTLSPAVITTPRESDEFDANELGLQWQWHANYHPAWYFCDASGGLLRLFSVPSVGTRNLWDSPNLLLQKTPADVFTATARLRFTPSPKIQGERAGLVCMGLDYATLYLEKSADGVQIVMSECFKADKGTAEQPKAKLLLPATVSSQYLDLRLKFQSDGMVHFSYSADGKKFEPFGTPFKAREGKWIGAKVGLYANRPVASNDGGWVDVDWFRITP